MEWKKLLSPQRIRQGRVSTEKVDLRSEFEKDYHRIIGSPSFRRLQDKTQVFPLDQSDFIRTRLTHSLEVASFGKSMGQNIGEKILETRPDSGFTLQMKDDISDILECAGLIHDIGNPPFGHFGEIVIREWFTENLHRMRYKGRPVDELLTKQMLEDLYHFEGNAQAFRLVTKLHFLVDEHGMNLTCALLNAIIKYPVSSLERDLSDEQIRNKKVGYYYADEETFRMVTDATGAGTNRHPLTFILEAADDLAYKTADIEDAYVKGFIKVRDIEDELSALQAEQKELKIDALAKLRKYCDRGRAMGLEDSDAYGLKNWLVSLQSLMIGCATESFTSHYDAIMEGTYQHDLYYDTDAEWLMRFLGDFAHRRVFETQKIYKKEVIEASILNQLMDWFISAVIYYDTEEKQTSMDERFASFISDNYRMAYRRQAEGKSEEEKLYLRLLLATDYICGMTDSYAKSLYRDLQGLERL